MKPLPSSFFASNAVKVARNLLGKVLEVNGFRFRIVETEAYGRDQASHAYKRTERSALMYDTYGHVYVYLIYGLYHCLNFTTDRNDAGAVLIRAVEPLEPLNPLAFKEYSCNGPGKLCRTLGIDKRFNGLKIGAEINIFDDGYKIKKIASTSRIGIKGDLHLPWRFYIEGNKFVSKVP